MDFNVLGSAAAIVLNEQGKSVDAGFENHSGIYRVSRRIEGIRNSEPSRIFDHDGVFGSNFSSVEPDVVVLIVRGN